MRAPALAVCDGALRFWNGLRGRISGCPDCQSRGQQAARPRGTFTWQGNLLITEQMSRRLAGAIKLVLTD